MKPGEHNPTCPMPSRITEHLRVAYQKNHMVMEDLLATQELLRKVDDKLTCAIAHEIEVNTAIDAALAVVNDPGACDTAASGVHNTNPPSAPKPPPPKTSPKPPPSSPAAGILMVVILALSGCVAVIGIKAAQYRGGSVVGESTVDRAIRTQKAADFHAAAALWQQASDEGADRLFALGEKAYCEFAAGDSAAATRTCDDLFREDRSSHRAHYILGMIAKRAGDLSAARYRFRLARFGGEPLAELQLRKVGG